MPVISANGIDIAYDDRGIRDDPAILLIMGLATQMIAWPEAFCDGLNRCPFLNRGGGRAIGGTYCLSRNMLRRLHIV